MYPLVPHSGNLSICVKQLIRDYLRAHRCVKDSCPQGENRMENNMFKSIADEPLTVSYVSRVIQDHAVRFLLAISLSVVCFLSASAAEAAPVIQLMTPQSGP